MNPRLPALGLLLLLLVGYLAVRRRRGRPHGRAARWAPWLATLLLLVVVLVVPWDRAEQPSRRGPGGFLGRSGTTLLLGGVPFWFTGYNNYVMMGCGGPDEVLDDAERDRFFASLRSRSVVRVMALPGTPLASVDKVVASARRAEQYLVLTLTDALGGCGDEKKDEGWYRSGYRGAYLSWLREVVPRYAAEPTVAMWELVNEPVPPGGDIGALLAFFDDAGGLVHRLDPHHLVSSGTLLPDSYGGREAFTRLSASLGVDVVSMHEYDQVGTASPHLEDALAAAATVRKPLMVGEWGILASPDGDPVVRSDNGGRCESRSRRAALARAKLRDYFSRPGVAGALYWAYSMRRPTDCSLGTFDGDPLMSVIRTVPLNEPSSAETRATPGT